MLVRDLAAEFFACAGGAFVGVSLLQGIDQAGIEDLEKKVDAGTATLEERVKFTAAKASLKLTEVAKDTTTNLGNRADRFYARCKGKLVEVDEATFKALQGAESVEVETEEVEPVDEDGAFIVSEA